MNDNAERKPASPQPVRYRLPPVRSQHVDQSDRMILAAAESVEPGRAVVLGAGNCAEIPLARLVARFEHVTLNDVDAAPLEEAIVAAQLGPEARKKVELRVADLTGVTQTLLDQFDAVLPDAPNPAEAIEQMARLVDDQPVAEMPIGGRYHLVVASCVLSQLHFALVHQAGDRFEGRFADSAELLRASPRWTTALGSMARRMESRFIDGLLRLCGAGGRIYLSESPQMCYVQLTADGDWASEGSYRMLRTADIRDYLDRRFATVEQGRWNWVVSPPERAGQVGRLFEVQALVLRAAEG